MLGKKKKYSSSHSSSVAVVLVFTALIMMTTTAVLSFIGSGIATPAAATTATSPPVTATTDNESVDVVIDWEPTEIVPNEEIEFTLDFQDPSSGDSISHVNYNFEVMDENSGETVASATDRHTHSGSDEQTVTFDTEGSFNLVLTVIGTGVNPPFDTAQSGTAETVIMVGVQEEESPVEPDDEEATDDTTTVTTTEAEVVISDDDANATLGNLFYFSQDIEETFNPINETFIQISYLSNVILMPPNDTDVVINATETGNFTANVQPDGLFIIQGQGLLMTEDDGQEENATTTFVALTREDPDGTTGNSTGVVFFTTDSTGQLAFLNNMIGIAQVEFSPEEYTLRIWEWNGVTLP